MLIQHEIEPIVRIDQSNDSTIWGELLCRCTPRPKSVLDWRVWYSQIPALVEEALQTTAYTQLSINLDTWQLFDTQIMDSIKALPPGHIVLEWTETVELGERITERAYRESADILTSFRAKYGHKIALDDYGRGMDGFGRLCFISPDAIKFHGEIFRQAIHSFRVREVLLCQIKALAGELSHPVVIEWIESQNDLALARRLGARYGQGYFWSKANSPVELAAGDAPVSCDNLGFGFVSQR